MPFEIVCCISSHDSLVYNYLSPIARHPLVSKLWIVRDRESRFGDIPKSEYAIAPSGFLPLRFLQMLRQLFRLGRRPAVRAYVSFNPVPYGLLAWGAARVHRKPIHFGFIGGDWYWHAVRPYGVFLLPFFRRADFITATGEDMRRQMLDRHFPGERISILPHGVDLDRFNPGDPARADYAAIYVGDLVERKRVDIILMAFARVTREHRAARLCIVGRGPEESRLKSLAASLGIAASVDFMGFQRDPAEFLRRSRIVLIASSLEGFPFSLIEGVASGLVPVTTAVGTIADHIRDGENGLIVPYGDTDATAGALLRLMNDPGFYAKLREGAMQLREQWSFEAATRIWDPWLREIEKAGSR